MEFKILGSLAIENDGHAVDPGGPRQRALLAILLLHRGEVVSAERLIDELYGSHAPASAATSLRAQVSRLRKTLDLGSVVQTRAGGYVLEPPPDSVDADRFERLVAEGRRLRSGDEIRDAAERFREALGLWRGSALSDFVYDDFAQSEIARLEELRIAATEERIAAELDLGRHAELVGELKRLVRDFPLRERLRGQLMLALYRSGRQAEALEAYQDARRAVTEELGLEPLQELRELQRAILAQDPALGVARAPELGVQTPSVAFVGREAELKALRAGLDQAFKGQGALFVLVGEPGIGKTRLAEETLRLASQRGARILVGRCWEAGGAPAYWPWVQALRPYFRELDDELLAAQVGSGASDLTQLFPELAEALPGLPEPLAPESDGARLRLFDAATELLKAIARDRPLVVFFDDLHAADEPSLLLLRYLAREIAETPLLFIVALRDVDPTLRDPLRTALSEFARESVTHRISLSGLHHDDVADYIARAASTEPDAQAVAAIHSGTAGNPLFVGEIVRLLDSRGRLTGPIDTMEIPPEIHSVIGSRVARLSEPCRALLSLASVLGREFGVDVLQRLSAFPEETLYDALDEAMVERIIGDVPAVPNRFRFAHVLIRDTLYDELTTARRLRHHREAAVALELVHASELEPHFAEIALHLVAAGPASAERAVNYARQAADLAASSLAFEEAARLYEVALTLAVDEAVRADLLLAVGEVFARAGDTPASKLRFDEAARIAESEGFAERLGQAALGYGGRIVWEVARDDDHLIPLIESALDKLPQEDSPLRARLLARLAGPLRDSRFPPVHRHEIAREALAMARRLNDASTLAFALAAYLPAFMSPSTTEENVAVATELIELATETGELERAAEGYLCRACQLLELGRIEQAKEDADAMAQLAGELRQPSQMLYATNLRAHIALLEGDFTAAELLAHEALGLGERAQRWNASVAYHLQLFLLRDAQGRLAELAEMYEATTVDYRTYPIFDCVLARLHDALGQRDDALAKFEELAQDDFASIPFDEEWLASVCLLAEVAESLDDARRAHVLDEFLSPYAGRVATSYPEIGLGAVARYLGLLAMAESRWDDAARHFERALEVNGRIGADPWLARTQEDYARMLRARGRAGDESRAKELFDAAVDTYRELGMAGPLGRATAG
jgi:DNA-binding SARP family transcriptional activator/tetratricopeptide (TPR) repeat protein